MSACSEKYGASASAYFRYLPSIGEIELSGIFFKILGNSLERRLREIMVKFFAGQHLIYLDVPAREFGHQFRWSRGQNFVFVGITMVFEPQSQKFFIKIFRFLTGIKAPFV